MMGFVPLYSSFPSGPTVLRSLTFVKSSVLARPANADAAKSRVCRLPGRQKKNDKNQYFERIITIVSEMQPKECV